MGLPLIAAPRTRQQIEATAAPGTIAAPVPFWDAARAGFDNAWNVQRLGARDDAQRGALWDRWQQIRQKTGQQLPASYGMLGYGSTLMQDGGVYAETSRVPDAQGHLQSAIPDADFEQRVDDLRTQAPAAMAGVQTADQIHQQVSDRLTSIAGRAAADEKAQPLASFAGGVAAQAVDPVNLAVGALTGGAGEAGVPLARALLMGGGKQALIWGGLAAAEAPAKMAEAEHAGGPAYRARDAVSDVAQAAAGGFVMHGAAELLGAAGRRFLARGTDVAPEGAAAVGGAPGERGGGGVPATTTSNVIDAEFTSVETPALTAPEGGPAPLALPAPDDLRGAAQVVDKAADAGAAIGSLRDGGDYDGAQAAVAQGDAPAMPEPTQDPDTLLTDADPATGPATDTPPVAPGVTLGDSTTFRGRDIYAATFDPQVVNTAPEVFQYKGGGDAAGVTDRLRGVQTWDPTSAGRSMVFEDGDGAYTIADGHQRLGLAKRLADQDPTLDALLFRQADGWSAQDVRTLAALKNIREGSGTPLDAAKVLRDHPEALNDDSLPVTGTLAEQGRGLARLSDDAFGAVVNDVIPQHHAALIGNMAGDRPDLHAGMVDLLHRGRPANVDEARALVSEALEADWAKHEGVQDDMFGAEPTQPTVIARAKVKAAVLRQVRGDAKLFGTLTRNADAIEAGGNALARSANEASLAVNRAAEAMISKLAYRDGDIGAAMRAAAEDVHGGAKPADAARRVADLVRKAIQDGDAVAQERAVHITPDPPSPAAEKAASMFEEPGGAGQKEQLGAKPEEAEAEAAARTGEAFPGLFDDIRAEPNPARVAAERLAQCAPGA